MEKSNFRFLEDKWIALAKFGMQGEIYVYSDPQTSLIKLRCFAELIVDIIYQYLNLSITGDDNFFSRLTNSNFEAIVDRPIIDKLHALRINGNKAAHKGKVGEKESIWLLKEAYVIGRWLFTTLYPKELNTINSYVEPAAIDNCASRVNGRTKTIEQDWGKSSDFKASLYELDILQYKQIDKFKENFKSTNLENQELIDEFSNSSKNASKSFDLEHRETINRLSLKDIFSRYTLNKDQTKLIEQLEHFLNNKGKVFLLRGYAGTGKTFITKGLTEYFRSIGRNYVLAAPTGKAAKVISNKTKSPAHTIHKTIYSFKDLKEYKVGDLSGSETYKLCAELRVNEDAADTVYIFDEASMISDVHQEAEFLRFGSGYLLKDLFKYINLDHNDHNKKIIFIGDSAQLPPVGMNDSPALNEKYLTDEYGVAPLIYDLKVVVRQAEDSGILSNATNIRNAIEAGRFNQLDFDLEKQDVEHIDYQDLIGKYMEACQKKISDEAIIIASSNEDVYKYNKRVRQEFFPGSNNLEVGDRLLIVQNTNFDGHFVSNGDFGTVAWVSNKNDVRNVTLKQKGKNEIIVDTPVKLSFRDIIVEFVDNENNSHKKKTKIIENLLYSGKRNLTSDESKAIYVDFRVRNPILKRGSLEFKESLRSDPYYNALKAKFGYAITCHKSQGSEWENVFIKCNTYYNVNSSEYFKWLYTAVTRSSNKLYVLDEPHFQPWSGLQNTKKQQNIQDEESNKETNHDDTISPKMSQKNITTEINEFDIKQLLYKEIDKILSETKISIKGVAHHQYQEKYTFSRDEELAVINFYYNSKAEITKFMNEGVCNLSKELTEFLLPLKGLCFSNQNITNSYRNNYDFKFKFLEDFHNILKKQVSIYGINISDLQELRYCQRYTFARNNNKAVIDIYYNKKHNLTKYVAKESLSNSNDLIKDIEKILSERF